MILHDLKIPCIKNLTKNLFTNPSHPCYHVKMEGLGSDRFGGLCVSIGTGIISFLITWYLIPELSNLFLSANLAGKDLNKRLNDYRV